ncbi:hypothetical protein N9K16_00035 [Alphaproteobacteria bacterium]|nr:hypothetical protein [Alphaproteobacteria bacterium]
MTNFSDDAIHEIRSLCQQTTEKTVVRLRLATKPKVLSKDHTRLFSGLLIAGLTVLIGAGMLWLGIAIWATALAQLAAALLCFVGLGGWHFRRQVSGDQQERLQAEAVQHFRGLSDRDEDRRLNVLVYLCEEQKRLFFVVGEHVASIVPAKLWTTISEGFERQAKDGDLEQAVVLTLKTVSLLMEVSLPALPIEQDASTEAVVQSLKTVCDPVFAEERQEQRAYPAQIGSITSEVTSPYADLGAEEELSFPSRAAI